MFANACLIVRCLSASVLCSISFSAHAETFEESKVLANSAALSVANDVNTSMLTSESNGEDTFSVSGRNGSSWSTPVSLDSTDNVGYYSSLAIDSNDHLHVTYRDGTNGNLEYMNFNGSSWSTPISIDSTDNVGRQSSLAIDSNNHLHVTYLDNTNDNLEYVTYDGSSWSCLLYTSPSPRDS